MSISQIISAIYHWHAHQLGLADSIRWCWVVRHTAWVSGVCLTLGSLMTADKFHYRQLVSLMQDEWHGQAKGNWSQEEKAAIWHCAIYSKYIIPCTVSHLDSQLQVLLLTSDELVCVVAVHDVLVVSAKKKKCRVWYHCHCKLKKCIVSLLVDMHGIFNNYALFFFSFSYCNL